MVEETSLLGVWESTVVILVGAVVMGALEKRVTDPRVALVVALIAGVGVAVLTPIPQILADTFYMVRAWIFA